VLATVPLVGFAVVASVLVRDGGRVAGGRTVPDLGVSTSSLALLYATTFGVVVAMAMFLPGYLEAEYRLAEGLALATAAGCVVVAALVRPVGGWLTDRGASARTLRWCLAGAGGCVVVQAFAPPLPWCALTLGGAALCLGLASGTVLALIGVLTPPERVGTVAGTVGAIGAVAGLAPPALLAVVYTVDGSFGIAMTLLATLLMLTAARVRQLEDALTVRSTNAILATATRELVKEFDSVDYLHRIATWCAQLPHVDAAAVLLANHHGSVRLVACPEQRTTLTQLLESHHDGPVQACLRTGTPMYDTELATTVARWQRFASLAEAAGFASVHALPMRLHDHTIGVLTLLSERRRGLPTTDIPAGQTLADLAAIAVVHEHAVRDPALLNSQHRTMLRRRALIDQATGVLAKGLDVDMNTAFAMLHNRNRSLTDAAREVINSWRPPAQNAPETGSR
jgi:hypothetical protein